MKDRAHLLLVALAGAALALGGCGGGEPPSGRPVVLAMTTSVYDTGLMDALAPAFTARTGITVRPIPVGSGQAIALCRRGEADVLLAHSPAAERELLEDGVAVDRRALMHNDFLILGPPDDPAGVAGSDDVTASMATIAQKGATFVSRGDDSGTHARERHLWRAVVARGLMGSPAPGEAGFAAPWYLEAGVGMGKTLLLADERGGYVLADRGTALAFAPRMKLEVAVQGDPLLLNHYHIMRVSSVAFPGVAAGEGARFVDWMTGPEAREIIAGHGVARFGRPLFVPEAEAAGAAADAPDGEEADAATGLALIGRAFASALGLIASGDAELLGVVWLTLRVSGGAALLAALLGLPLGALVALGRFPGRSALRLLMRAGMALPPVVVGLIIGVLFWRSGPLGAAGILYTPVAMVLAQVLIALPIVAALSEAAVAGLDPKLDLQVRALGATSRQRMLLLLREARGPLLAATLAGFGRAVSEVGASLMVGGNILGQTRVLTTATVLEVGQGDFERALGLGLILLLLALGANLGATLLERRAR